MIRRLIEWIQSKFIKDIKANNNMIYRYSGWDSYSQDSLKDRYFWFSKPTNFNDPFDSNMECLKAFNVTNQLFCYDDPSQVYPINNPFDFIKKQTDNYGVLCFTEKTSDGQVGDKGFNNSHFWSHYANYHKGIALGFEKKMLETYYSEKLECQANLTKVRYREKPINLDKDDIILEESENYIRTKKTRGIFSKSSDDKERDTFFKELLLMKDSRIWGVENESRIILGGLALANLNNNKPFSCRPFLIINELGYKIPYPDGDVLKEVTFGVKFPQSEIAKAKSLISNHHGNVKYYQAELDFINGDVTRSRV